jgi:hypothetical protein
MRERMILVVSFGYVDDVFSVRAVQADDRDNMLAVAVVNVADDLPLTDDRKQKITDALEALLKLTLGEAPLDS